MTESLKKALKAATLARRNSYSPYSKFKVGAAVQLKGDATVYSGCNVENASYGATICAERVAVYKAISEAGSGEIDLVVVVTDEPKATVPCALCLQVLAEFCSDRASIHLANLKGIKKSYKLRDLLPKPFRSFESNR